MTVTFSPASFDFGDVICGSTGTQSFSVTNSGPDTATLTCTGVFTCSPSTVPGNGVATTVVVTFAPTALGPVTGTVADSSNTWSASLAGNGVFDDTETDTTGTRFRLDVPSPNVIMTLGKALTSSTYDGFGVTANDNVFFNANQQFWAQATGDLCVQSTGGNVAAIAGQSNLVFGKNNAALIGGGGTFIASGLSFDPASADGVGDLAQQGVKKMNKGNMIACVTFGAFDVFVGITMLWRQAKDFKHMSWAGEGWKHSNTDKIMLGAAILAGVTGVVVGALDEVSNAQIDGAPNLPGVTIYGETGIMMGTPAFASIYALGGLCMASLFVSIAGYEAEVVGKRSAALTGYLKAHVSAGKKVEITSDDEVEITAHKEIKLSAGPKVLERTCDLTMTKENIKLTGPQLPVGENIVEMNQGEVRVVHGKKFLLSVGGVKETSLLVTSWEAELKSGTNMVKMGMTEMSLTHKGKISIKANSGSAGVDFSAAGAAVKANRILLG